MASVRKATAFVKIAAFTLAPWQSTLTSILLVLLVGANAFVYLYRWLTELRAQYGTEQTLQFVTTRTKIEDQPCAYGGSPRKYMTGKFVFIAPIDRPIGGARSSRIVKCFDEQPLVVRRPLVFVHGYNNDFMEAADVASRLASDLKLDSDVILFSWHSYGAFTGYIADVTAAQYSAVEFERLVDNLRQARVVPNVLAHSMGAQVVTAGLERLAIRDATIEAPIIDELILAAPDLDVNLLTQRLPSIRRLVRRVTLYVVLTDIALKLSEFVGRSPRSGRPSEALLALSGVDIIDVSLVEPGLLSRHHSYYQYNSRVLQDEFAVLGGKTVVGDRFGTIEQESSSGTFWQLRPDARQ